MLRPRGEIRFRTILKGMKPMFIPARTLHGIDCFITRDDGPKGRKFRIWIPSNNGISWIGQFNGRTMPRSEILAQRRIYADAAFTAFRRWHAGTGLFNQDRMSIRAKFAQSFPDLVDFFNEKFPMPLEDLPRSVRKALDLHLSGGYSPFAVRRAYDALVDEGAAALDAFAEIWSVELALRGLPDRAW